MGNKLLKHSQKGQSTIEFVLTFTGAVGFIFLFMKMAINYTNGYMVHHATYLAARSYLVSDTEQQTIEQGDVNAGTKAKEVFKKYLPEALMQGLEIEFKENNPADVKFSVFVGVFAKFEQAFSVGFVGGKEKVEFISEAFLGREPTRSETIKQTCEAIKSAMSLSKCSVHATLDDNGG